MTDPGPDRRLAHEHASGHSHGSSSALDLAARTILDRGLGQLLTMTEGLGFETFPSERYPLPITQAVYGTVPEPALVRSRVAELRGTDPVAALEGALVLLELYESNQPGISDSVPDDESFLGRAFRTKRLNAWLAVLGDAEPQEVAQVVNVRWQFELIPGREGRTAVYPLLNMLARYGFVYGRIPPGDSHALSHFLEDFGPAVLVCYGQLPDLELTLSLAAMKLGVPAVVPADYPFPLGRQVRARSLEEVVDSVTAFRNIHRLLDIPDAPRLPDYLSEDYAKSEFVVAATWGDTEESFYILQRGAVEKSGVDVIGQPHGPMGVVLIADAIPLDAFDCRYIEARAARVLSMICGVSATISDGRLVLSLAENVEGLPECIGETLVAAIRYEFPRIERVRARLVFDSELLAPMADQIRRARAAGLDEIASATEETVQRFVTCVGCSPFAPDHVCILTPERPPQCGRAYEMMKTGALYGYDDTSNIHHRALHAEINSFGTCAKGEVLDPVAGEWSGVNDAATRLTGGRTRRIQLHSLEEVPHTGCGCFRMVMFKTDVPRPGIGIMHRGYRGRAPDGRSWVDLHYALAGKQTVGIAGASAAYLSSAKFLTAHGGWDAVVWVSDKIAAIAGERLPDHVSVGQETVED